MAVDRRGAGLVIVRVCLGMFFIAQALTKLRWFMDSSILAGQLMVWAQSAAPGSISQVYLQRFAVPGAAILARLVPLGEFVCGAALIAGFSTSLFAFIAFLMVLNYQVANGTIFHASFLASRADFPVLGSTLGLAIGGARLPWSLRG
jgi:uncharacterized membrane protein YphA (DoxX/SURF4 family)